MGLFAIRREEVGRIDFQTPPPVETAKTRLEANVAIIKYLRRIALRPVLSEDIPICHLVTAAIPLHPAGKIRRLLKEQRVFILTVPHANLAGEAAKAFI